MTTKLCLNLAQKTSAWLKACGKTSVLQTKPIKSTELKGLKLSCSEIGDVVQITKEPWQEVVPNLRQFINPKNSLGQGFEGMVYAIDENYVLKALHGADDIEGASFHKIVDVFEGKNFGQAVAESDSGYAILKRVNGTPLYKQNMNHQEYFQAVKKYSELSDETLEAFISDIAFIKSKGYQVDYRNGANFLYDKNSKRIGFVDLTPPQNVNLRNQKYSHLWVLDSLVNPTKFYREYCHLSPTERKELVEVISKLEDRIIPMCKKYDIPVAKCEKDLLFKSCSLTNMLNLRNTSGINYSDDMYEWVNAVNMSFI